MKLVVGLGNQGKPYAHNRHNAGFQCLNRFARRHQIPFDKRQCRAHTGVGEVADTKVVLAKPRTFMNLSGESVVPLVRRFDVALADLIVIYDDVDLPLGQIRIRPRGGSGGHNGMKSIIAHLGSQDFARIRVGVGPLEEVDAFQKEAVRTPDYVLSDFTPSEAAVIKEVSIRVADAIDCILAKGLAAVMNKYN